MLHCIDVTVCMYVYTYMCMFIHTCKSRSCSAVTSGTIFISKRVEKVHVKGLLFQRNVSLNWIKFTGIVLQPRTDHEFSTVILHRQGFFFSNGKPYIVAKPVWTLDYHIRADLSVNCCHKVGSTELHRRSFVCFSINISFHQNKRTQTCSSMTTPLCTVRSRKTQLPRLGWKNKEIKNTFGINRNADCILGLLACARPH